MNKKLLILSFLASYLVFSAYIFKTTNSHPSSTGAPGELTCARSGCHQDAPVNPGDGVNTFVFGNNDSTYMPGQVYDLLITVSKTGIQKFGFQILALRDADNTPIGTFIIKETLRTQLQNGDPAFGLSARKYVTHKSGGTPALSSGFTQWAMKWEAPASDKGNITFYIATNATNNNNANNGDAVYLTTKTITYTPFVNVAADNRKLAEYLQIFPNPVSSTLSMTYALKENASIRFSIVDLSGREVYLASENRQSKGHHTASFELPAGIAPGTYFMKLSNGKQVSLEKFTIVK